MRYAQIRKMDISNGEGIGIAVFTQGCPFHCKNCFNPETWDFDGGTDWTQAEEDKVVELLGSPHIKRLTILGGEPLINNNKEALMQLLERAKRLYPAKKVWLYTGAKYEDVIKSFADVLQYVDVLIDGRYVDELRDYSLKFRGSSNQRVIDVQKSVAENKVVLYLE